MPLPTPVSPYILCIHMGLIHGVIRKWGNSLGLRLPKSVLEEAGIGEGTPVELKVKNGVIVVAPVKRPHFLLKSLLSGVSPKNTPVGEDFGETAGSEIL